MQYQPHHRAAWRHWILGLATWAFSSALIAAPRVDFGHYAPGAPMVNLEVDGETRVSQVGYRLYVEDLGIAAGTHTLRVRSTSGSVLTEREFVLGQFDKVVLFLAGDGRPDLPYQLLLSYDHNHLIEDDTMTLQSSTLSVVRGDDGTLQPTQIATSCASGAVGSISAQFGGGTEGAVVDGISYGASYAVGTRLHPCDLLLAGTLGSNDIQRYEAPSAPGLRLRQVISGNGRDVPLTVDYIEQGIEQTVSVIDATPAIDGLWYDPTNSGSGILIAHAPTEDEPHRVKAIIYGFGHEARSAWRVLDGDQILQYAGGDPEGTRAVIGVAHAQSEIRFHSCELASLRLRLGNITEFTALPDLREPREVIVLRKLVPAGCNPPGVG